MLIERYNKALQSGEIKSSPTQREAILALDRIAAALLKKTWFWKKSIAGLYMYGPVGAGKTFALDLFYQCIPDSHKARYHFHHFMQMIDNELRQLQGKKNPLQIIARSLSKNIRILCLDEFLIHDVADAMIFGDLLQELLAHNLTLIATANLKPDDLYLDGVHRERFLPAIALIKEHCIVMNIDDHEDHRLGRTPTVNTYLTPLNSTTAKTLNDQFAAMTTLIGEKGSIKIQNREIMYEKKGTTAIWFDFNVICSLPRSQLDYLELANTFKTIFISNIPQIPADDTIHAILFIHFIDVMYDMKIHLVLSAESGIEKLYPSGPMREAFQRTESRLQEMQSIDYLRQTQ